MPINTSKNVKPTTSTIERGTNLNGKRANANDRNSQTPSPPVRTLSILQQQRNLPLLNNLSMANPSELLQSRIAMSSYSAKVCRVIFYVNGDRHFRPLSYVVNLGRIRTLDSLCAELSRILVSVKTLPSGVRIIFDYQDGGSVINSVQQLKHCGRYVCSSADHYINLNYPQAALSHGSQISTSLTAAVQLKEVESETDGELSSSNKNSFNYRPKLKKQPPPSSSLSSAAVSSSNASSSLTLQSIGAMSSSSPNPYSYSQLYPGYSSNNTGSNSALVRPKIVVLLRGSCRAGPSLRPSRSAFRFLLNRRITQTFDQLLNEISRRVRLNTGAVYHVYGLLSGKKITSLENFSDHESVYLVYGRAEKCSPVDFQLDEYEQREIISIVGSYHFPAKSLTERPQSNNKSLKNCRKVHPHVTSVVNSNGKNSGGNKESSRNSSTKTPLKSKKPLQSCVNNKDNSMTLDDDLKTFSLPRNFYASHGKKRRAKKKQFDQNQYDSDAENQNYCRTNLTRSVGKSLNYSNKLADDLITSTSSSSSLSLATSPKPPPAAPSSSRFLSLYSLDENEIASNKECDFDYSKTCLFPNFLGSDSVPTGIDTATDDASTNMCSSSSTCSVDSAALYHHHCNNRLPSNHLHGSSNSNNLVDDISINRSIYDYPKSYHHNNRSSNSNNSNNSNNNNPYYHQYLTQTSDEMSSLGNVPASSLSGSSTPGAASSISCSEDFSFAPLNETSTGSSIHCSIASNTNSPFLSNTCNSHNIPIQANIVTSSRIQLENEDNEAEEEEEASSDSSTPSFSSLSCSATTTSTSAIQSTDYSNKDGGGNDNDEVDMMIKSNDSSNYSPQHNRSQQQSSFNSHLKHPSFYPKKEVNQIYKIGDAIGDGKFGVVYTCVHRASGRSFAMKVVDKCAMQQILPSSEGVSETCASTNEVAIMKRIHHPNIVRLCNHFDYVDQCYLVLELLKGGDLFDAISLAGQYPENESAEMITDLIQAVCYLHRRNIVHRDIKLENLMVCFVPVQDGRSSSVSRLSRRSNSDVPNRRRFRQMIKLADFGLAVEVRRHQLLSTICGTPTYVAPEILLETGYSFPVDIWAAGVIAYILLCGFPPFANEENDQDLLFEQIISGNFGFVGSKWVGISRGAKQLIKSMLCVDYTRRLTASQVLCDDWLTKSVGVTLR